MTKEQMYRILMVAVLIGIVVSLALLVTGCGNYYDKPTATKMDEGNPPNCYTLTDTGLTHDVLGVYCRTTTTTAPR